MGCELRQSSRAPDRCVMTRTRPMLVPEPRLASPVVSAESLASRSVIPSRHSLSSRDIGWHSLLLEVHTGVSSSDAYSSIPTAYQIVGVALSGHYTSEVFRSGRWQRGAYDPGAICIHSPRASVRYRFPIPERAHRNFSTAMVYVPHAQMAAAAEHVRRPGASLLAIPRVGQRHDGSRRRSTRGNRCCMARRSSGHAIPVWREPGRSQGGRADFRCAPWRAWSSSCRRTSTSN
jgi:hypothetical protein